MFHIIALLAAISTTNATPFLDDNEAYIQQADIPSAWVHQASRNICDFQGKWHLILDKSESLDPILTGLQFGWFKKKALRNFAPTTYVRFSDHSCYTSESAYETAMSALEKYLPKTEEGESSSAAVWVDEEYPNDEEFWGEGEDYVEEGRDISTPAKDVMEGMRITIVRAASSSRAVASSASFSPKRSNLYMYMKTLFPWHNVKEGVVAVDGPAFEHHDSDTGLWSSAVTFENGRIYQKRVSEEYGTMYDIRAVFMPPFQNKKRDSEQPDLEEESILSGADDGKQLLNLTTWTGLKPLMLFKWTLVAPDGQIYSTVRWNEKMIYDSSDSEDLPS